MKTPSFRSLSFWSLLWSLLAGGAIAPEGRAQILLNVDFGAGSASGKVGFAAAGQQTNDFWNAYGHYQPKYQPGTAPVPDGRLEGLRYADGSTSPVAVAVSNAPGVWGNATGDPMLDSYMFAPNGSNMVVTLTGLDAGRYHFYLYGWAAPDVAGEQASSFILRSGTNTFGPLRASPQEEAPVLLAGRGRMPVIVQRDLPVETSQPVVIEVVPAPGGVAVLNGLQVLSRGTGPPRLAMPDAGPSPAGLTNLLVHSIAYTGEVAAASARFLVSIHATSPTTNRVMAPLFEGELALLDPQLPDGWQIVRQGRQFTLHADAPGSNRIDLTLAARVTREEPWSIVRFTGPPAAAATLSVRSADPHVDLQLASGVPLEGSDPTQPEVRGVVGADRQVAVRWQAKATETTREALVTVDTRCAVDATPAAIRLSTTFACEVLQGRCSQIRFALPSGQTLTKLSGDLIKDWQATSEAGASIIMVDLIRPLEGVTAFDVVSEQPLPALPGAAELRPPQPLGIQRETGRLGVRTEDLVARVDRSEALWQVNAAPGEFAAFQFNLRPAVLHLHLSPVEPLVTGSTRVRAAVEETRLLVDHRVDLNVSRAGIYGLEWGLPPDLTVAHVEGEGIEDWQSSAGKLRLRFAQRLLGQRVLTIRLEQALNRLPSEIILTPLRLTHTARETALIGAGASAGIQLKTGPLSGAREIPVSGLPERRDELLAFRADAADWRVILAVERLSARIVAEVFNLITIGDGLVGGGATIRFGIVNQGVQQFRVRLPAHWRNVEFTGANIRRKDREGDVWTITLQDKVWGGYTLVVTYDHGFDPQKATLDAGGAHPLDVERETGAVAITSAANLALEPAPIAEPLRRIDPSELAATDRALVARPVLLAYRYEGPAYALELHLMRHEEVPVLDAVADRAQFTSVLTDTGEMLTQASFLVKNNERAHQRFELAPGATLWGVAVNGEPVRADRDGDWVVVALPRGENRDQIYAIDLKYAQQVGTLGGLWPRRLELDAPKTDVPGTYAEWVLHVPPTRHVYGFGGTLEVTGGTTYGWRDGWDQFIATYRGLWHEYGAVLIFGTGLLAFVIALVWYGNRKGFGGVVTVLIVFCFLAILAGMLLPALSKAKSKAQRINSLNNLKQIGLAARLYAGDNQERMPDSFEAMRNELGTDKVLIDPETGQRYTYVGAGKSEADPNAIIAYSPERPGGRREVVFADGSVQIMSADKFFEATARDQTAPMDQRMLERYGLAGRPQVVPAPPAAPPAVQTGPAATQPAQPQQVQVVAPIQAPTEALADAPEAMPVFDAAGPTAAGIKSIRFDLPKAGRAYTFTRVLSVEEKAPRISVGLVSNRLFTFARAAVQVLAFLAGLMLVLVQWRSAHPKALWLTVGLMLAGLATADLLIAWRVLHLALTLAVPALLASLPAWWLLRWRQRARSNRPPPASPPDASPGTEIAGTPSAAGTTVLAMLLLTGGEEALAASSPQPLSSRVTITRLDLTGSAGPRAAQFDATLLLVANGTNASAQLFGADVAVQESTVMTGDAQFWRNGDEWSVFMPHPGSATLRLKLLAPLGGDLAKPELNLALPPALGGQLTLVLSEPDADVEYPDALGFVRRLEGETTVVEAVLGGSDRLNLRWTPKRKRADEVEATVFANQTALVTLGNGAIRTRAVMDWQVSQGELRRVCVRLPSGSRLLKVQGPHVRSWQLTPTNADTLEVDLLKPVTPGLRLTLELEQTLDALPVSARIAVPEALDVKRQTGSIGVRAAAELGLSVERASGLDRVDNAEFAKAAEDAQLAVFSAWRFLRPDFDLDVRAEVLQPRTEVLQRQHFTVGLEQTDLLSQIDYTITRLGVFALRLRLPAEGRLEAVASEAIQSWTEHTEGTERFLDLTLKERTIGRVQVEVRWHRPLTNLPPVLALAGVHPLEVAKLDGYMTVSAGPGVGLKTTNLVGVVEIPAATVPGFTPASAGALAFKHLTGEPSAESTWSIALATEQLESWIRAEIVTLANVGETRVSGQTLIRYEIQNAPTREFRLKTPPAWRNVELLGAGIRRRDHTDGEWRIELQNKVMGLYRLTVPWEMPRGDSNTLVLAGLQAVGVEREAGAVGLLTQGQLQLAPGDTPNQLLRIDARELPGWATSSHPGLPVLCYRYLRPGWTMRLDVRRFQDAAVLQGLVDSARLRTVLADDGQQMTQMELSIRNNGRQNLAVALPNEARLWSAFVDGQPVRPARRDDRLLLPLERPTTDDAPIAVEVVYVGRVDFPRVAGPVRLDSPWLDLPLKDARWELFVPPDYSYRRFAGTMSYESAEMVAVSQDFTFAEYQRQELSKQASFEARAVDFLQRARTEFATGNLDKATQLKGFKGAQIRDQQAAAEFKRLEADVNRAQSIQLIEAQRNYVFLNNARLGLEGSDLAAEQAPDAPKDYDTRVAEQQVAQLQKVQALAETQVAPLRVNLPTRGLRFSFVQALQTEPNKPLTIRLHARNGRDRGWFQTAALWLGGLVLVWGCAAVALALRTSARHARATRMEAP
ncbi:MAG TPA: magnesium transporter [Candidatus Paceibacterota bacterium]|nr:magnesium transporter [Candidatus Paceibacterota bacterium]